MAAQLTTPWKQTAICWGRGSWAGRQEGPKGGRGPPTPSHPGRRGFGGGAGEARGLCPRHGSITKVLVVPLCWDSFLSLIKFKGKTRILLQEPASTFCYDGAGDSGQPWTSRGPHRPHGEPKAQGTPQPFLQPAVPTVTPRSGVSGLSSHHLVCAVGHGHAGLPGCHLPLGCLAGLWAPNFHCPTSGPRPCLAS